MVTLELLLLFIIFISYFISFLLKNIYNHFKKSTYHTGGGTSYKNKNCFFGENGKQIEWDRNTYYRDLPCGKDIFRAYWIIYNYNLGSRAEDFIGAILLKWI